MNSYLKKLYDENQVRLCINGKEIKLYDARNSSPPEVYADIYIYDDSVRIYKIDRNQSWLKYVAKTLDEAYIYALIVFRIINRSTYNSKAVNFMRDCFENDNENMVYDFIENNVYKCLYSIGLEEYDKISLINTDTGFCVRFMNRDIVENRTKEDGYVVLYNYCRELKNIRELCCDIQRNTDIKFSLEKAEKLYIFNDTVK